MKCRVVHCLFFALAAGSEFAAAAAPRLVNIPWQVHKVDSGLAAEFRVLTTNQNEPAWIGYAVPLVEGDLRIGVYRLSDPDRPNSALHGYCQLETDPAAINFANPFDRFDQGRPSELIVLCRVQDGAVRRIRVATDDCELDAGGLPFHWLTGVQSKESIAWLARFATPSAETPPEDQPKPEFALAAIALHRDPVADETLEPFTEATRPEPLRANAALWLGQFRGARGCQILRRMLHSDPSPRVREQCAFALSVSKAPEAVKGLIDTARNDKSPRVRGLALLWVSQKAAAKIAPLVTDAIRNDPDIEAKKSEIAALGRLPKNRGLPKLIDIARLNKNPSIRREAIIWLGRSNDRRALSFLEQLLAR